MLVESNGTRYLLPTKELFQMNSQNDYQDRIVFILNTMSEAKNSDEYKSMYDKTFEFSRSDDNEMQSILAAYSYITASFYNPSQENELEDPEDEVVSLAHEYLLAMYKKKVPVLEQDFLSESDVQLFIEHCFKLLLCRPWDFPYYLSPKEIAQTYTNRFNPVTNMDNRLELREPKKELNERTIANYIQQLKEEKTKDILDELDLETDIVKYVENGNQQTLYVSQKVIEFLVTR